MLLEIVVIPTVAAIAVTTTVATPAAVPAAAELAPPAAAEVPPLAALASLAVEVLLLDEESTTVLPSLVFNLSMRSFCCLKLFWSAPSSLLKFSWFLVALSLTSSLPTVDLFSR